MVITGVLSNHSLGWYALPVSQYPPSFALPRSLAQSNQGTKHCTCGRVGTSCSWTQHFFRNRSTGSSVPANTFMASSDSGVHVSVHVNGLTTLVAAWPPPIGLLRNSHATVNLHGQFQRLNFLFSKGNTQQHTIYQSLILYGLHDTRTKCRIIIHFQM